MSKKQDAFYFDNFIACSQFALDAAERLKDILVTFKSEDLSARQEELHAIERAADEKRHSLTDKLAKAFITPIEREDIVSLSHNIDEVTDKIEEVLIRIYINGVREIRPEAFQMLDLVIECCREMCGLMREFPNFKKSDRLMSRIIRINTLEEQADALYISSMRDLHRKEKDLLQIIAWREIYDYREKCADACEHVANAVESIMMKNS